MSSADDLTRLLGVPFSDQQLAAITAPLLPGVIVAGAGSGKTTVMAARVVWLVATGQIAADQVLGLTFTNKAAAELSDRISAALAKAGLVRAPGTPLPDLHDDQVEPDEVAEPTVLTYHAYAARLLAEHGLRIGHEPDTTLIADASRFQLAARAVRSHDRPVHHLNTWLPSLVTSLLNLDAQLLEHLVGPDVVRRFDEHELPRWQAARQTQPVQKAVTAIHQRRELLGMVEDYRALKRRLGVMDFSDQMSLGATLAETCPEVGSAERERYRVVLLDEYQDTSVAQARLLVGLFSGPDADTGRGHPVTAVGDPCQAIYGWRGASVSNLEQFQHGFPTASDAEVMQYPLSVNRRSDTRILATANDLAKDLYAVHQAVQPLRPTDGAHEGSVQAALHETYQDELNYLAEQVPRVHANRPGCRWSDIGVLVRDNKTAGDVHDALTSVGVPVEVVGLSGLLQMPEICEIVATLEVLQDVTANSALLTLLAGPRWAIGPRDLALLGRRAQLLAATQQPENGDIAAALADAVARVDAADVVSLAEALDDLGNEPYSPQARERFRAFAAELRGLRRFVGEPLLDLVRRVIDTTGIDTELASSISEVAAARRNNIAVFLDAVTNFAGVDGDASLTGLLAYFEAEEDYAQGLSLAVPTEADSVKLLTVHRAKGLEWDVVFVPGMCATVFPSTRGRSRWPTAPAELPGPLRGDHLDLPQLPEASNQGLEAFKVASKQHELLEERRLGYVAVTRPRHQLIVSAHWWGPEQKEPRGPSPFWAEIETSMHRWHGVADPKAPAPDDRSVNPAHRHDAPYPWPVEAEAGEVQRRRSAAALVQGAVEAGPDLVRQRADHALMLDEQATVGQWDAELNRLIDEARAGQVEEVPVRLPAALSATTMARLRDDPDRLARDLARPMPRRPAPAARFGTRFHAWVEAHVGRQSELLEPDDLPGRADEDVGSDRELRDLIEAFEAGPFGTRIPAAIEAPFTLVLAGQLVRGRIDAVYSTDTGFLVVDWKTNREQNADPLQLAIYRLAWAELRGVELEQVEAAFYYVRSGDLVAPASLPGRAELERLVTGEGVS